jgi:uncharacterized protein (TIGR02246 family)
MKRSLTWHAVLCSMLALAAVAAHAQSNVQVLADRWVAAYNTHDRAALGAIYTEDARLMMHGSPTIEGRQPIEEFWAADLEVGNPLTLLSVTHNVVGSDMILVHGDYRVIGRDSGKQLGFGRFAHLWTRDGNSDWRLDRDLWNQPYESFDPADSENDVQALADRWTESYNMHDRDGLAAVYTDDAYLMMHGAPTIAGREEIGDFWATDFEEGNPLTLLTVTHAVDGLDMVLVHGDYEVVSREDGSRLGFGRFAHIWNDVGNGEWRLDRDMWVQRFEPYPF